MATKNSNARAKKQQNTVDFDGELKSSDKKKITKTLKKTTLLIVCLVFLVIGLVGGYFAHSYLSAFEMNVFKVNGVESEEVDYVEVDVSLIKEGLEEEGESVTMEKLYSSITLEDGGVKCTIFGIDLSNTISVKYYYRQDISHDAEVVDKIDLKTSGVYYVEYTSSNFLYKSKTLIRTILVTGVENDG